MPTPPTHSTTNTNPNFLWGFGSKGLVGGVYEYSFNGFEKDDEIYGVGNSLDFGARIYDSRTGRWLSLDPLAAKYPNISPYVFVKNNPLIYVDKEGEENVIYLVALPSAKSELSKTDLQAIADKANEIYKNLGLETRVVVFDGSEEEFDPKYLDESDSYALIGNISELKDISEKNKYNTNGPSLKNEGEGLTNQHADRSVIDGKGILLNIDGIKNYQNATKDNFIDIAGNALVHGSGHNAGFVHPDIASWSTKPEAKIKSNEALLMVSGGTQISSITGISLYGGEVLDFLNKLDDLSNKKFNSKFISGMKASFFGNNHAMANYKYKVGKPTGGGGAVKPTQVD